MVKISSQALLGIIILIIGILLLAGNLGLYDTGQLLLYIPSLFILMGLYALYKTRFHSITGPLILILVGTFVQLLVLGIVSWNILFTWWPLILVLIGVDILFNRKNLFSPSKSSDQKVDMTAVFDDVKVSNISKDFVGGNITVVLGDSELNMKESVIKSPPAKINIMVLLGEINIKVPDSWQVEMDVVNILGDVHDKRPSTSAQRSGTFEKPHLIITGFVMLGDFSIKD
ncbi:putative transmembrane protein [Methanolobus psychrophilus R15]|nr:putative transmembrane protein [Methanolobus psychrophilus R15]